MMLNTIAAYAKRLCYFVCAFSLVAIVLVLLSVDITQLSLPFETAFALPNIISMTIGVIFLLGVFYLVNYINPVRVIIRRYYVIVLILVLVACTAIQFFVLSCIYFQTGWDAGLVYKNAAEMAITNKPMEQTYYQTYPNNLLITFLFAKLIQIAELFSIEPYFFVCCFNVVFIQVSAILASLSVKKMLKSETLSVTCYIYAASLYVFSGWMTIPYSDTWTIVFPVGIFYLYLVLKDKKIPLFFKLFPISLLAITGYLIKPTAVLILIAIMIHGILSFCQQKKFVFFKVLNQVLSVILALGFSYILVMGSFTLYYQALGLGKEPTPQFGMAHFFMLGLNEERCGAYNQEFVDFSYSFSDSKERAKANIEKSFEILSDMGVSGYLQHLYKKTITNFNDGTFAWEKEGTFYAYVPTVKENMQAASEWLRSFFYRDYGDNLTQKLTYNTWYQIVWLGVLCLCTVGAILYRKRIEQYPDILIVLITLFGLILFHTLFEARARYLYNHAPLFAFCAVFGCVLLMEKIKTLKYHFRENAKSSVSIIKTSQKEELT